MKNKKELLLNILSQLQWYWDFSNILIDEINNWSLDEIQIDNLIHLLLDSVQKSENERKIIEYEVSKLIRIDNERKEREKEIVSDINIFDF